MGDRKTVSKYCLAKLVYQKFMEGSFKLGFVAFFVKLLLVFSRKYLQKFLKLNIAVYLIYKSFIEETFCPRVTAQIFLFTNQIERFS